VADALSRPAAAIAVPAEGKVNFEELARQQLLCAETQELAHKENLQLQRVSVQGSDILCDTSTGVLRPLVPADLRKQVFLAVHGLAHPGTRATCRLVAARYVWRGCSADIAWWCKECVGCARGKTIQHVKTQVEPIPVPRARFQHVHVDLVGPLPVSTTGRSYLMTIIDRTSRWPEAVVLPDITAETCTDAFVHAWVTRFGVPHTVTTDRGTQFTSATWACLACALGFKHVLTTAYHPQANGMVERLHRQIKEALRARQCGAAWELHLPWVLLGLRAAPKDEANVSAAEVVYGEPLQLPGQAATLDCEAITWQKPEHAEWIPLRPRTYVEVTLGPVNKLAEASYVYVRRGPAAGPLAPAYDGLSACWVKVRKFFAC
jgi:transposase InsO family protein